MASKYRTLSFTILLLALLNEGASASDKLLQRLENELLFTPEMTTITRALSEGYPAETHTVMTTDGYLLELHRIPFGLRNDDQPRPVVFLMHCQMCSSIDFLLNYPDKALGFFLADQGYDVWMGNARGNVYSRNHMFLNPDQESFWKFSFNEIALCDVSASIDKALAVSGARQLTYIGFSSGSTELLVLLSEKPEYNEKVKVAAFLAPSAFRDNASSTLFRLSPFVNLIERLGEKYEIQEVNPQGELLNKVATTLCSPINAMLNPLCLMLFSLFITIDEEMVNQEFLPLILSNNPAGGSLRTILHSLQNKEAGEFRKFDFGSAENIWRYGTLTPPSYNLDNVQIPVGLFVGKADKYVPPEDARRLANALPNLAHYYEVQNPKFSHFDFLWSKDTDVLLYYELLSFLNLYN